MTHKAKILLVKLIRSGKSFEEIKNRISCSDSTIKTYMKEIKSSSITPNNDMVTLKLPGQI